MERFDEQDLRRVVVAGHVDHGKSTLLGRILLDCGRIADERLQTVGQICAAKGIELQPAFFFDALMEEQEQGVSIDTTRVYFQYKGRRFLLIDAPGHLEFLKNMTSGASEAEFGVLVVDCLEGLRAQTSRHLKILGVLGIREIIVAVNKLDKAGYDRSAFDNVCQAVAAAAEAENVRCLDFIPLSALHGDNVTRSSAAMPWYQGESFLPALCHATDSRLSFRPEDEPFRMLLQDVYRFDDQRYFVGLVTSGSIAPGARVCFFPSGKVSQIEAIEVFPDKDVELARKGDSIALRLSEQVFVERGEVVALEKEAPDVDTELRARIAWLSPEPLDPCRRYLVKLGTGESACSVSLLGVTLNGNTGKKLVNGEFADVVIKAAKPLAFDRTTRSGGINKLVICSEYETLAAGVVDPRPAALKKVPLLTANVRAESGYVGREAREARQRHKGAVLWLTGLSGAGKSTLARALERRLFDLGYQVLVLDGDNLRGGLCAGLGFSREDRSENVRRIAHVARLLLDTGFIVVAACISPYAEDRELARQIIGPGDFNEIFVFCPLEVCQQRDPKGLYRRASSGELSQLTGVDFPYQPPREPALRLDTSKLVVEAEVAAIVELLRQRAVLRSHEFALTAPSEAEAPSRI